MNTTSALLPASLTALLPALLIPAHAVITPAAAADEVACVVESHSPDVAPDARTVALLTCDALRARGVAIGSPTESPTESPFDGPAYHIGLHPLGTEYLVRIARKGVAGQPDAVEQIRLARLGDIDKAAPRLAEALTGGRALAQSQEMETVTAAEAQKMEKKDGDFMWGVGVYGIGVIGTDDIGSVGFQVAATYETPVIGVHSAMRFGGAGGTGQDDAAFFEFSVGGRYFFSPSNTSVFVGGGLSGLTLGSTTGDATYFGGGLGGYGEAGVEFLRLYRSRLAIEVRASIPFFDAEREDFYDDGTSDGAEDALYLLPITMGLGYYW